MNEDILDAVESKETDNSRQINRIILLMVGSIILFMMLEELRSFLPENLLEEGGIQIKTIGLLIAGIVVLMSIILPSILNTIKPSLNELQIVIYSGLSIFITEFLFKLIQNIFLLGNGLNLAYFDIFKVSALIGCIGMLIANIRVHKIRKKRILIPVLLLVGIWLLVGFLVKK